MAEPQGASNEVRAFIHSVIAGFEFRRVRLSTRELDYSLICNLGDDVQAALLASQEANQHLSPEEADDLSIGLSMCLNDVRVLLDRCTREQHHGRPNLVTKIMTGKRGRPRLAISANYLSESRELNNAPQIARFLGVSRWTVRQNFALLGIPMPNTQAVVTDDELVARVRPILENNPRLGVTMVAADLRRLFGVGARRARILEAVRTVQPGRSAQSRAVVRRRYDVPGPLFLCHHDGHHGELHTCRKPGHATQDIPVLIMYGIVTHAFVDGHSRLIMAIRAAPNNKAKTVLALFLEAAKAHGVPSRVRGDHGVENLLVAAWMEAYRGPGRGSYIWGRSVHNTRIERLWRDLREQVVGHWKTMFQVLESEHGLEKDNTHHKWLLHLLFLDALNADIADFAERWNTHVLRRREDENLSPRAMFFNDMLRQGFRGDPLPADGMPVHDPGMNDPHPLPEADIEWFGIEGEVEADRQGEHIRPWMGASRRPENGPAVVVDDPMAPFDADLSQDLLRVVGEEYGRKTEAAIINVWRSGLAFARLHAPNLF